MAERYTRLFSLSTMKYQEGAPVVITAGALLKDSEKNAVLVQLKIKSISDKVIKAVKVSIQPLNTVGEPAGNDVEHQYLDVSIVRDEEFGSKEAVYLPDNTTRQFNVCVLEVAFEDNTTWKVAERVTADIEQPDSLSKVFLNDVELVKQYKIEFGKDATVFPAKHSGIWFCNCSAVNRVDEMACHKCGKKASAMFSFDEHKLTENRDARLLDEAYEKADRLIKKDEIAALTEGKSILQSIGNWKDAESRVQNVDARISELKDIQYNEALKLIDQDTNKSVESARRIFVSLGDWKDSKDKVQLTEKRLQEFAQQDELAKIQASKSKKRRLFIAIGCVAFILVAAWLITKVIIPSVRYNEAVSLTADGKYEEAIAAFENLEGFKDSEKRMNYAYALKKMDEGQYVYATRYLNKLSGYLDADELLIECNYQDAINLMGKGNYTRALKILESLSGYKDAEVLAETCRTEEQNKKEYELGKNALEQGDVKAALEHFSKIEGYSDSKEIIEEINKYINVMTDFDPSKAPYRKASFDRALQVMHEMKHIEWPKGTRDLIEWYAPFVGKWTFREGNDQTITENPMFNLTEKTSITEMEIVLDITTDNSAVLEIMFPDENQRFLVEKVNRLTTARFGYVEDDQSYIYGEASNYYLELVKEGDDTLVINSFDYKGRLKSTAEYKRAN